MKQGRVDGGNYDVHHIYGRGEGRDVITNLMAVCRKCHDKMHNGKVTKSEAQLIHNFFLGGTRKQFLK
jgi:5-methylcytosine-specific restriction endonuclease McrA